MTDGRLVSEVESSPEEKVEKMATGKDTNAEEVVAVEGDADEATT